MADLNVNSIGDASGGNTTTINGYTPTMSNMAGRNRIINGDMRIDQRNAGASVTLSGNSSWPVDRFLAYGSGSVVATGQQSSTAPTGFVNSLLYTVTTGAAVGSNDYSQVAQLIEGLNVADLGWGTANASSVTISFWVRSSLTGTFGFSLANNATNRTYVTSYTINSANTWEQKTITIAGDTTGTWLTTNGVGIRMQWDLGFGSTYNTSTTNSWQSGAAQGLTGGVKVAANTGATWYITGVQLEAGSVATPFEHRQYGQELALCQRYFEKSYNQSVVPGTSTSVAMRAVSSSVGSSTNRFFGDLNYAVPKRTNGVSITFYSQTGTAGVISRYDSSSTTKSVSSVGGGYGETAIGNYIQTSSGDSSEPYVFHFTASSEL